MNKIRWGIIGVGDVTEVKSGPAFYKSDNSELVAVMRRNGDKAKDFAKRHNVAAWYDDADALINDPNVDAVYIATPPHVHKDYTLKVAAAGKHVYTEKPMALTFAECQEMIQACEKAGVKLWVGYYRRALAKFLKIKELLDSGSIGEVQAVSVRLYQPPPVQANTLKEDLPWRVLPEFSGGGIFVDVGSHMVDLLDFFLGPISEVDGFAANVLGRYPAEDVVSANFRFESGVVGFGTWNFSTDIALDETVLVGSKGRLTFSTFNDAPFSLQTATGEEHFSIPFAEHVHQPLVETIIAELRGQGKCESTAESGARASWFIDQILL